jgi:endonuclease IV
MELTKHMHRMVHGTYFCTITLPPKDERSRLAVQGIIDQMVYAKEIGATQVVIHPGSRANTFGWMPFATDNLNTLLFEMQGYDTEGVDLLLENGAGKTSLHPVHIAELIDNVGNPRIKMCVDTAHLWGAAVGPIQFAGLVETYGEYIGAVHLNSPDEGTVFGSWQDRHTCSLYGGEWIDEEIEFVLKAFGTRWPMIIEGTPTAKDDYIKVREFFSE